MPHARNALLCLLLATTIAHADDKADKADAAKHYELGKRHYNLNEWPQAIKQFRAAYRIYPDPVNLYNIAQSYRLLKKCTKAAEFYASYQREEKVKKLRDSVSQVRKKMEACAKTEKDGDVEPAELAEPLPVPPPVPAPVEGQPPPPAPVPPPPPLPMTGENALRIAEPPNLDPNRNRRMLSYVLLGVGGVSLLTGVGLSFKVADLDQEIEDCDNGVLDVGDCGFGDNRVRELEEQRDKTSKQAGGAYGFGAVCVIGGGILFAISRKPKADQNRITVMPTRHGAAVSWTF
jgi:tetratricopeptide (TPR) repeat protein